MATLELAGTLGQRFEGGRAARESLGWRLARASAPAEDLAAPFMYCRAGDRASRHSAGGDVGITPEFFVRDRGGRAAAPVP